MLVNYKMILHTSSLRYIAPLLLFALSVSFNDAKPEAAKAVHRPLRQQLLFVWFWHFGMHVKYAHCLETIKHRHMPVVKLVGFLNIPSTVR